MKLFRSRNPDAFIWCSGMDKAKELLGVEPEMLFVVSDELIMEVEDENGSIEDRNA